MKRALLVVDVLKDFVEEGGVLYIGEAAESLIQGVKEKLDAARDKGHAVIFACDRHDPSDAEFETFPAHCCKGDEGAEIIPSLAPRKEEKVIFKRRFSAFFGTDLDLTLRERSIEEVEIVGVCTNICVLYTAADARMLAYRVRIPRRAVASYDEKAHTFALGEMSNTLGAVVE